MRLKSGNSAIALFTSCNGHVTNVLSTLISVYCCTSRGCIVKIWCQSVKGSGALFASHCVVNGHCDFRTGMCHQETSTSAVNSHASDNFQTWIHTRRLSKQYPSTRYSWGGACLSSWNWVKQQQIRVSLMRYLQYSQILNWSCKCSLNLDVQGVVVCVCFGGVFCRLSSVQKWLKVMCLTSRVLQRICIWCCQKLGELMTC